MNVRIETSPTRLLVKNTSFAHKDVLKAIAGSRWCQERKCWTYPLSPSILQAVLSLYPSAEIDSGVATLQRAAQRQKQALDSKSSSEESLQPIEHTVLTPWSHQLRSYHFARHLLNLGSTPIGGGCLLGLDMGTGKTKVVYDLINNNPELQTILVTCPKPVVQTWVDELAKHECNRKIVICPLGDTTTTKGKPKQWPVKERTSSGRSFLKAWPETSGAVRMIVINHESIWREPFKSFVKENLWDLLVADECHRAKSPGGKFSTFLSNSRDLFATRLGLTGM